MVYALAKHIFEDVLSLLGILWRGFILMTNKFWHPKLEKKALILKGSKESLFLQKFNQCRKKHKLLKIHMKSSKDLIEVNSKTDKNIAMEQSHNSPVFEFVN